ncbi:MAG: discoidin domain-containing protein [Vallitalea sp.]|jgi:hypothetical protein|nr:discoidin domain-containing protein [Vallitalea sp.]
MKKVINKLERNLFVLLMIGILTVSLFNINYYVPVFANSATEYYVSPNGNDSNDGTISSPFKTLKKARDIVRGVNSSMSQDIIIYLRGGEYSLTETFTLSEQDSGTNGYKIIYKAYNNETPIISGGKKITGWTQTNLNGHSVYKANVSGISNFRELYINDTRATRANSVNGVDLRANGHFSKLHDVYKYTANSYYMKDGKKAGYIVNKSLFGNDLRNGDDFELVYRKNWRQHRIAADGIIDNGNGTLTFEVASERMNWYHTMDYHGGQPNTTNPFYVENSIGLLDYPGEWYYDKTAKVVYYYPKSGEDMSTANVYVPTGIETLVNIEGSSLSSKVSNVSLEGITFEYSAWLIPFTRGTGLVQANFYVTASGQGSHTDGTNGTDIANGAQQAESTIDVSFAENLDFRNNVIRHTGGTALRLYNGVNDVNITGNNIYDISETGILLGTWLHNFIDKDDEQVVKDVLIRNNTLNGLGREYYSAPSIAAYYTDSLTIEHNDILHSAYGCINYGWNGWQGNASGISGEMDSITSRNTIIRYNRFEEYSEYMGDTGATYSLGQQPNTEIYGNYYKNGNNYNGIIYYDEGTAYATAYNNVIDQHIAPSHGISWHCSWTPSIHDYYVYNNYSNWTPSNIKGIRALVKNNHFITGSWPAEAQAIIDNAGVTSKPYVPARTKVAGDVAYNSNAKWLFANLTLDNTTADYQAQNALDGNTTSVARAATNNAKGILEIDMFKPYYINKATISFDGDKYATDYIIQASIDGIVFKDVAIVSGNTNSIKETTFDTIEARHIRIVPVTLNNSSMIISNVSIIEDSLATPILPAEVNTTKPLETGLVMWVDGDSATYKGNKRVSSWNDKKGSNNLKVPIAICTSDSDANGDTNTRKKPQIREKVISLRPALNFDGWDDSLTTSLSGDKQNNTFIYLAQAKTDNGLNLFVDSDKDAVTPTQGVISGEWAIWAFSTTNGVTSVYKNGVKLYTRQAGVGNFSSFSISENRPIRDSGLHIQVTNANIAEIMAYNKGLTQSEITSIQNYFYNKYQSIKPCTVSFTNTNGASTRVKIQTADNNMIDVNSNTAVLSKGNYTAFIGADGYTTASVPFSITDSDLSSGSKTINATLSSAATINFNTNQGDSASDLDVTISGETKDAFGEYNLQVGAYNYTAISKGFNQVSGSFNVIAGDISSTKTVSVNLTPNPIPVTLIDDADSNIVYGSFDTGSSANPSKPCYSDTRHHNYGVINQGSTTVNQSIITYTFKGTGIEMYNEVEGGVTNIEVNIYKGMDTTGEQIDLDTNNSNIKYAIANQRRLEDGSSASLGVQVGNQKTFSKINLVYGYYTIELKPSITDITTNNMNGFITLDALKILDSRQSQPQSSLKAHWEYENNSTDSSNNANNGTLHGDATYTSISKVGSYALNLDGNGDYMSSSLITDETDNVSISLWVKPTSVSGVQILAYNGNTTNSGYGIINVNNNLGILIGGKDIATSNANLTVDVWSKIDAIRRNGTWELYVNGVSKTLTNNTLAPNVPTTGTCVGANNSGTENFSGSIDEVKIYEEAITVNSLQLVHWTYDNNSNDNGQDGINGTLHGDASYTTSSKVGTHALNLDGNGDYMSSALATNLVDNVSISLWVKPTSVAGTQILIHNGDTSNNGYGIISINNKIGILNGGIDIAMSNEGLTVGQWSNIIIVRRSGTWELYIDGVSRTITNNKLTPNAPTTGTYVGANSNGTENYNGVVDDVKIIKSALTSSEIQTLAN